MKHNLLHCPDCGNELTRVRRTNTDRIYNLATLGKYFNKRYRCHACLNEFTFSQKNKSKEPDSDAHVDAINTAALSRKALTVFIALLMLALLALMFIPDELSQVKALME